MKDNNDKLIAEFMHANRHEIADNGFSERVIRKLPNRAEQLARILNIVCASICVVLFVVFDGFKLITDFINELFQAQSHIMAQNINYQTLAIAFIVCIGIGVERACSIKW